MRQQMAIGGFVFGLAKGFCYERLERRTSGGWVDLDIIASKPMSHQTGQDLETLRLSGSAMYGPAMERLDDLRALVDARVPYVLVDGVGRNWGRWRIDRLNESQARVIDDGTAMVVDWTLELKEFVNA